MLFLPNTTDKLQLVTDASCSVDVGVHYADNASGTITNSRQLTAITTATTTDILGSPAGSTTRKVRSAFIRNKHATSTVTVTVVYDANGTDYELHKVSLKAGELLEYIENVGFFVVEALGDGDMNNAATADQTANAADTYLTGSSVAISGRIKAGTFFRWRLRATKTAASTAVPTWNLRVGTNGSTADTARCVLSSGSGSPVQVAQTAAADEGWFELEAVIRTYSASGVIQLTAFFTHRLATTGFQNVQVGSYAVTSSAFDLTAASLILGLSVNPGTAGVWTFQSCSVDSINHL